MAPLVATLTVAQEQLAEADARIAQVAKGDPIIRLCATAPGVAVIVAATFVSVKGYDDHLTTSGTRLDERIRSTRAERIESALTPRGEDADNRIRYSGSGSRTCGWHVLPELSW
ncbi:MAG TPA: hypothetical protein VGL81_04440 [Polyangiaceae bacterium]|jgi:hypothetical protein